MKKFTIRHFLIFAFFCLVGFLIPFITKTKDESLNSTLSTSFTIVSTIVAIITLIVAIAFFDRYGFNAKFKERQLDTVLSLVNELKLMSITISNGEWTYLNYIRKCSNLEKLPKHIYGVDKTKTLLVPDNFYELLKSVYILYNSPWLPPEIKEKMNFLNIFAKNEIDDFDNSKYVKLNINGLGTEPWVITAPKFTFEIFSINLSELLVTTLKWITEHSNVKVDFDLVEAQH